MRRCGGRATAAARPNRTGRFVRFGCRSRAIRTSPAGAEESMNPGRCGPALRPGCASSGAAAGRAVPERGGRGAGEQLRREDRPACGGCARRRWDARPGSPAARCAGFDRSESLRTRFPAAPKGAAWGASRAPMAAPPHVKSPVAVRAGATTQPVARRRYRLAGPLVDRDKGRRRAAVRHHVSGGQRLPNPFFLRTHCGGVRLDRACRSHRARPRGAAPRPGKPSGELGSGRGGMPEEQAAARIRHRCAPDGAEGHRYFRQAWSSGLGPV